MEETLITFETAKLAKEKGFDIPCENFYVEYLDDDVVDLFNYEEQRGSGFAELYRNNKESKFSAPTQSLLQKWLREIHGIIVQIVFSNVTSWDGNKLVHYFQIGVKRKENNFYDYIDRGYNKSIGSYDINSTRYPSWEEALERGLQEALLMIK
jgi:hypothetical protein